MKAKRLLDLCLAVPGLVVLSPLLMAVALWVKLDSRGPAFFRQVRVGRGERLFRIWKFRTMSVDAERRGGQITSSDDPRVTRAGKILRSTKLDELPQLINVVRGEMSLVGPRPEVPRYVEMYSAAQRRVLELTPGITDPASIRFRDEGNILAQSTSPESTYVNELMPAKIELNLHYAENATVLSDIGVILRTLFSIVSGRQATDQ